MSVKNKAAKKKRIARARRHLITTRNLQREREKLTQVHTESDLAGAKRVMAAALTGLVPAAQETPARTKCPSCHTSQKVRADGTIGKHRTTLASDPLEAVDCPGIGQPWNASS